MATGSPTSKVASTGKRRAWPRRARRGVLLALALYVAASVGGSFMAVAGNRNPIPVPAQQIGKQFQDVTFASRTDHFRLSGWLFHAPDSSGRSVILVHGWKGNREDVDFVPIARRFLSEGYDVLMFDMRGSGQSAGTTQTFANDEPRDLLGAYDFMVNRGYNPSHMAILGNSMGGATVIESAPQLPRVGALICDSSYVAVTSVMEGAMTRNSGPLGLLGLPTLGFSRLWGVDPGLQPIAVVSSLPRAFLFIQSSGDNLVDPNSARELRAASPNPASRLLIIRGHSHLDTYNRDPSDFMDAVNSFINSQIAN